MIKNKECIWTPCEVKLPPYDKIVFLLIDDNDMYRTRVGRLTRRETSLLSHDIWASKDYKEEIRNVVAWTSGEGWNEND